MGKRGIFITLEGGDGAGKSTQAALLQKTLSAANIDAITTREPGGTPQAERIRNLLLQRDSGEFDPLTEALLLSAARREHIVKKIRPALEAGQWVISDRFADSTRAFQGCGMGLDMDTIERLYKMVAGDLAPDLTLIFDLDPETGIARSARNLSLTDDKRKATEDRYERMGLPFHRRLRAGFLDIAKNAPDRCIVIDAAQDMQAVHRRIVDIVAQRFGVACREAQYG